MSEDPGVPFTFTAAVTALPEGSRPQVRKAAGGAEVIDIGAMIRELEASPDARRRQ